MFIGLGAVAFWCYVRLPQLRPQSVARAIVHVAVSFTTIMLLPVALGISFGVLGGRAAVLAFVLAAMMPCLCYLLLSWFWLLGCIVGEFGGGTPRGGHPVTSSS
jgi:hypothetical protein